MTGAFLHGLRDALLDGGDEVGGDAPADDFVDEFEAAPRRQGLEPHADVGVLAAAAGLLDVLVLAVGDLGGGLAVGDFGSACGDLDLELALHAVDQDVEVELAHSADNGLAGLRV